MQPPMAVSRTLFVALLGVWVYFLVPPFHVFRISYLALLPDSSPLNHENLDTYIETQVGQPAQGVENSQLASALARNLTGKIAVVTGGNAGLGFATVKRLAKQGATVVMGARDEAKAKSAIQQLETPSAVQYAHLDLESLESVKSFSEKLPESIDILVLNAGKVIDTYEKTADGIFEWSFGTMHIGHFYLTHLVAEKLSKTAAASGDVRVVVVSSMGHLLPPAVVDWGAGLFERGRAAWQFPHDHLTLGMAGIWNRYALAKLANVLFARELGRRVRARGLAISVTTLHPGIVSTTINPFFSLLMRSVPVSFSAEHAALTQLFCALAEPAPHDLYLNPVARPAEWGVHTAPATVNASAWEELWRFSVAHIQRIDLAFEPAW